MLAVAKTWTEEELLALPKDNGKYELVDGELVRMAPSGYEHSDVCIELGVRLRPFARTNKLGRVLEGQAGFWMKSGNLRAPDLSFVSKDRERKLERLPTGFFNGAPDLAVEVLSPSDRMTDLMKRIVDYFESGAKLAWVINPKTKTVSIYRSPTAVRVLGETDVLTGEDVVPGFTIRIRELFDLE
jgi:Uma2 family endonuclease